MTGGLLTGSRDVEAKLADEEVLLAVLAMLDLHIPPGRIVDAFVRRIDILKKYEAVKESRAEDRRAALKIALVPAVKAAILGDRFYELEAAA